MTEETKNTAEARAQEYVWVYMTKGDIDAAFKANKLEVLGKNGKPKKNPTRCEKEKALIEHYTNLWS